ncbi:MAG: hypothetical protein M3461_00320 [Pseudomonadota bacterium]|nr:hypothetical protein [Pseudomonadota bacterium]
MTRIIEASGHAFLSRYGKRQVAASMYVKGKAFIGATILLRRQGNSEGTDHVLLHLLCQGIEVTLKGLLLLRDYDRFIVRLRKPLGHNLFKVAKEASTAYGLKPLRGDLDGELRTLNNLYSQHLLRYGSEYDILVDPRTIPRELVFRRLAAVIRLAERELKRG